jgi:hypothetical protein
MTSQLFLDVTQRIVVLTGISGQPIFPFSRIEQKQSNHCKGIFQALEFQGVETLRFPYNQHQRVVKLPALGNDHLYHQEIFLVPICVGD